MEIGSMPREFEPTGEAKVYEDEVDPDWRDPDTAEDGEFGA
jgi:hypothetical protein